MRKLDIFLFDGVNALDVTGASQAFDVARRANGPAYALSYVTLSGQSVTASCGLRLGADAILSLKSEADDLLVPGGSVDPLLQETYLLKVISQWQDRKSDARLISVCSGALLLAGAGVLDGHKATTHWSRREQALRDYPQIDWQTDAIFTQSETLFTSAGVTAGIDLALAIIERDCGETEALKVARELVVYIRRSGGQTQYSDLLTAQFPHEDRIEKLIALLVSFPARLWTLQAMADAAGMTARTLTRKFQHRFRMPPIMFLEQIRVRHASDLLTSGTQLARAASQSGFGDMQTMRRSFKRQLDITPTDFIRNFTRTEA